MTSIQVRIAAKAQFMPVRRPNVFYILLK